MGRAIRRPAAPVSAIEAEAALERRSRQLASRIELTVLTCDPPTHPEVCEAVAKDLARARALGPGSARRDAIAEVGRRYYGAAVVERWMALPLREFPHSFTDPQARNESPHD